MSGPRFLDSALFDEVAARAAASPRRRQNHNFHEQTEPCHRLLNALQPDSYIPPHCHRHPDKAESLLVVKGALGLLIFSDNGELLTTRVLRAGGDCVGADLPPGTFHAIVALEPDSIMFEAKAGPFVPLGEDERGQWAPREGEAGAAEYLDWMRSQFPA
ncbi:cupin fold metalloprotein, WbuC family [Pseudomonas nitroreducens]|uniref:Cupin fold metalloprotein, WbuC family n=1 Tax=Pseudomonas nitroreducens TaxID=46680 RepID=A0A5R8ZZB4_PSENT|nr:WbuC family cupin fold metalloprotein [Pseudomonas nitroreducens]TLP70876.1 cupin fold metalloprotein, WbuC family [Pseudomonas nitroreducens]